MNGRIVLPEDTEHGELLARYVREAWYGRKGPRYTRTVGLLVEQVCNCFRLEPESLADSVDPNFGRSPDVQIVFVAYECPRDMKHDCHHLGEQCKGFVHIHWQPDANDEHFRALSFNGSAIDVAKELRSYFKPVSTQKPVSAGGIALPDLGGLEDRIGLTDFKRGL